MRELDYEDRRLQRSAEVAARRALVKAHDGQVELRGNIRSWAEKDDAASGAPGVTRVDNNIVVTL